MNFDFDSKTRRELGYRLIDRIDQYFSSLPARPVQLPVSQRTFGSLTDAMPELGESAARVLDEACAEMIDKGFHVPAANYFGLMNPTPTYMAVLAEALVAAINPQLATLARSQLASKIEAETVRWIGERVGWEAPFDGTFTSGGNEANFTALALALTAKFPEVTEEGVAVIGAQPVLYTSSESHHSLDKSVGLLGLGRKALRKVPVNARAQMEVSALQRAIESDVAAGRVPFCVVATAGTTNSGTVDDIAAVADFCARFGLWLHVDGAYGAAAVFSDKHRSLVAGIERADSVTIDPHKWLAMPFAAGVVLTRQPELLPVTFGTSTPYMPKAKNAPRIDNFKQGFQWSRRMNAFKLWLTLRVHGRIAYESLIDEQLRLARGFADWVRSSEHFELVMDPQLTILNLRLRFPANTPEDEVAAMHQEFVDEVTQSGERWISSTLVNGRNVVRLMVISYLTGETQIAELKEALVSAAEKVTAPAAQRARS